jgi:hypothetical protein
MFSSGKAGIFKELSLSSSTQGTQFQGFDTQLKEQKKPGPVDREVAPNAINIQVVFSRKHQT